MTILAFLQNTWHPDPERVQKIIDKHGRKSIVPKLLFSLGSQTGKRLRNYLGDDCCKDIVWENVCTVITNKSDMCPPIDYQHIRDCLATYNPKVVIAFGHHAQYAFESKHAVLKADIALWKAMHPTARQAGVIESLMSIRTRWIEFYETTQGKERSRR